MEIECKICCGGIPPSCSNEKLTCKIDKDPDFNSLYLLLAFIGFCIIGNYYLLLFEFL